MPLGSHTKLLQYSGAQHSSKAGSNGDVSSWVLHKLGRPASRGCLENLKLHTSVFHFNVAGIGSQGAKGSFDRAAASVLPLRATP